MASTPHERRLVDIAHEVMADEQQAIGIGYSGMCLTGLPYRKLPDDQVWIKNGHQVTLLIGPGHLLIRGKPTRYGVPLGQHTRGRQIPLHPPDDPGGPNGPAAR